ncbi:glycoside hydrolase family 65 protein [Bacillales bacterium]|uniref:glycoside hydrolase family 65 protein n=1 Tax=Exiguobacterium sp. S22-S28 TaxID=3342768 RepID=UPI0011C9C592
MKRLFDINEWKITEQGFHPEDNRLAESMTAIGNGHMGMRGNFEEDYSGDTHQGMYVAGVYYPDKTRVGWWKNGYPEYFAKVLNAVNIMGLRISINGKKVDLNEWEVVDFKRELDMQHGVLTRTMLIRNGVEETKIEAKRFFSIVDKELAALRYTVTPVNFDADVVIESYLDADVENEDSNYDEKFWLPVEHGAEERFAYVTSKTKKLDWHVTAAMITDVEGAKCEVLESTLQYVANRFTKQVKAGEAVTAEKLVALVTNRDYEIEDLLAQAMKRVNDAFDTGFDGLLAAHETAWLKHWEEADVKIEGDIEAQQGIRFNIFHMFQTYTGEDSRLNIGPKGFTGEKYGGATYWDTEAYCLNFYLATSKPDVAWNLLKYRHNQLPQAKENAEKNVGMKGALYPMVTMNGEECHNEWEITHEEIHRNGAIAHAIYNYTNYTGDTSYLGQYGFEVLVEIARYWASRVNYVPHKDAYMILGVTGPNEYENNVNNNWYTNLMAAWCLEYAQTVHRHLEQEEPARLEELIHQLAITDDELAHWADINQKMYYPKDDFVPDVFMQQDGFMDKEQIMVADLDPKHLPLNQNWSWDRVLRSVFIKQADVLQGLYFLTDRFSIEEKKKNFDFYEPRTVHESSLSPCIYSIIAAEVGYEEKAMELYQRSARLDLDNYNNDTEDGLHITSMVGSWMSIVHGFAGLRVEQGTLSFKPMLPKGWTSYSFRMQWRGHHILVQVKQNEVCIEQSTGGAFTLQLHGETVEVPAEGTVTIPSSMTV